MDGLLLCNYITPLQTSIWHVIFGAGKRIVNSAGGGAELHRFFWASSQSPLFEEFQQYLRKQKINTGTILYRYHKHSGLNVSCWLFPLREREAKTVPIAERYISVCLALWESPVRQHFCSSGWDTGVDMVSIFTQWIASARTRMKIKKCAWCYFV